MPGTSLPNRRSIRLKGFDYSTAGAYFVTLTTNPRRPLFGSMTHHNIELNTIGHIVEWHWNRLPSSFPHAYLDAYVVMPDHFHGIIVIQEPIDNHTQLPDATLGTMIRNFKSVTARKIHQVTGDASPIWQRNYFERVIRSEAEWKKIHEYILANPEYWPGEPKPAW